jgi:hypothetical protein
MVRESERGDCRKSTAIKNRCSQMTIPHHSEYLLDGEPTTRYVAVLSFGCDRKIADSGRAPRRRKARHLITPTGAVTTAGRLEMSFRRFENSRNVEVPAGTGTNRFCPGKRHERGSFPGHEHVFFRTRSRPTNTACPAGENETMKTES